MCVTMSVDDQALRHHCDEGGLTRSEDSVYWAPCPTDDEYDMAPRLPRGPYRSGLIGLTQSPQCESSADSSQRHVVICCYAANRCSILARCWPRATWVSSDSATCSCLRSYSAQSLGWRELLAEAEARNLNWCSQHSKAALSGFPATDDHAGRPFDRSFCSGSYRRSPCLLYAYAGRKSHFEGAEVLNQCYRARALRAHVQAAASESCPMHL